MSIIDTPFNTEASIPCLLSQGVRTVIRYYNFSNSRTFPKKRMELAEAQALAAHGMQIAAVFQQRQNQVADFTELKGVAAGRRAYRHAQDNIGQPAGSGIYFSVDFDATKSEITTHIGPYFDGVKRAFAEESGGSPDYRIGAYGSGLVCTTLTGKELIELTWLAMSRGFRGTREALRAGEFHLAQVPPATTLCGLGVDSNDPNPERPDFGAFTIDDDAAQPGPASARRPWHSIRYRRQFALWADRFRRIDQRRIRSSGCGG
jgi:Rv2525c-like, glycoside hydrolase-like domain